MTARATALIADDEPLLREALERLLGSAWPELEIVAQARNGREAIDLFEAHKPDICFLDVQMPGKTGVEAAQHIGRRAHLVFVTAFDQYAVQAFARGRARLSGQAHRADAPGRHRAAAAGAAARRTAGARHRRRCCSSCRWRSIRAAPRTLRWVRASVGPTVRLIAVQDIDFLRSEEKYTQIAWRDEAGKPCEAVIRTALKELIAAARRLAVRAGASLGGGESARHQSCHARRERDRGHSSERAAGSAARESQLPALVPADVRGKS